LFETRQLRRKARSLALTRANVSIHHQSQIRQTGVGSKDVIPSKVKETVSLTRASVEWRVSLRVKSRVVKKL
jgi:hypothetical protein